MSMYYYGRQDGGRSRNRSPDQYGSRSHYDSRSRNEGRGYGARSPPQNDDYFGDADEGATPYNLKYPDPDDREQELLVADIGKRKGRISGHRAEEQDYSMVCPMPDEEEQTYETEPKRRVVFRETDDSKYDTLADMRAYEEHRQLEEQMEAQREAALASVGNPYTGYQPAAYVYPGQPFMPYGAAPVAPFQSASEAELYRVQQEALKTVGPFPARKRQAPGSGPATKKPSSISFAVVADKVPGRPSDEFVFAVVFADNDLGIKTYCKRSKIPYAMFGLRDALVRVVDEELEKCRLDVWMETKKDADYLQQAPINLDQLSPLTHSMTLSLRKRLDIKCHPISTGSRSDRELMMEARSLMKDELKVEREPIEEEAPPQPKPKPKPEPYRPPPPPPIQHRPPPQLYVPPPQLYVPPPSIPKPGSRWHPDTKPKSGHSNGSSKTSSSSKTPLKVVQVFLASIIHEPKKRGKEAPGEVITLAESDDEQEPCFGIAASFLCCEPGEDGSTMGRASASEDLKNFSMKMPLRKCPKGLPVELVSLAEALEQLEKRRTGTPMAVFTTSQTLANYWAKEMNEGKAKDIKSSNDSHPAKRILKILHKRQFKLKLHVAKDATPQWTKLMDAERVAKKALGI